MFGINNLTDFLFFLIGSVSSKRELYRAISLSFEHLESVLSVIQFIGVGAGLC